MAFLQLFVSETFLTIARNNIHHNKGGRGLKSNKFFAFCILFFILSIVFPSFYEVKSFERPVFAEAMADRDIDLSAYGAGKDKRLTFTAKHAIKTGNGEGIAANRSELLATIAIMDANILQADDTLSEKIAKILTNQYVIPVLLSIGCLGLILELYRPGFGAPGFIGLTSLFLFFYGHHIAGLAGWETVMLFAAGSMLLLLEFFLPGGIIGTIGLILVVLSLLFAAENIGHMAVSLLIAGSVSFLAIFIMSKVIGKRMKWFKKIILQDSTSTEKGYVSNQTRTDLIGKQGVALTVLRPSGTVMIDNERLDVVTEGTYIDQGKKVLVVKAEGPRIIVREID